MLPSQSSILWSMPRVSFISSRRLTHLQSRHTEILDNIMEAQLNTIHKVYFDELKPNGKIAGRSDDGKLIFVDGGEALLGEIKNVIITKISRSLLHGKVIDAS